MTDELRQGFCNICPLGEPFSPPTIVFRDGMELRQIERDQPARRRAGAEHVPFIGFIMRAAASMFTQLPKRHPFVLPFVLPRKPPELTLVRAVANA